MQNSINAAAPAATPAVADTGRIRVGAGFRLPPAKPARAVADSGRIRFGAGFRLAAVIRR